MSQLGLAPVPISVNSSSGIGTNAKNLRGRSRDIRDRMSHTRLRATGAHSSSRRNATIQAARRFDDKPSIILIRPSSIIVTTLNPPSTDLCRPSPCFRRSGFLSSLKCG